MLRQRKICLRKRCLPAWRGYKASAAEADSCRRGVRLFAIIQQTATVVNNFLLYHRKTGSFPQNKNTKSGGKFCVLAKNYARSCAKSKPGTQNIGCNLFCRKIWILFKNGWKKQKSPAPQVPGIRRKAGYGVDLFRTKARTRRTIVPAARPR